MSDRTMRIFLTGGTGYIGSAVLDALLRGGHQVTALVRDPEKAERASRRGVKGVVGELGVPKSYAAAAEACDGIIHTAFDYSKRGPEVDRQAIASLLAIARQRSNGAERPFFIYTSGVWVLGSTTDPAAEDAPVDPAPNVAWRPDHEKMVLDAGVDGTVRTALIRPGIVYGGSRGIIGDMLKDAGNGLIRVIGAGKNHWPCVYDRDLADLYLRVATNPLASGIFHANDEGDERVNDIAEALAHNSRTAADIRHVPIEEARAKMGDYADALALDQKVRSPRARALGWSPALRSVAGNVARLLEEFRNTREAA
jgi:nucleoside-diphosphate-sugar epimerase